MSRSRKVPIECTVDNISENGGFNITCNVVQIPCEQTKLSDITKSESVVVDASLLALIHYELTKAKIGVHQTELGKDGRGVRHKLSDRNNKTQEDREI